MSRLVLVSVFVLWSAVASAFEPKLPASNLRGMNTVAVVVDVDDETSNFLGKNEVDQRFKKLLAELGIKTVPLRHAKVIVKIQVRSTAMPLPENEARSHMLMLSVYRRFKEYKATACIWHRAVMMPSALTDFNDNLDSTQKAIDVVVDGTFGDFSTNWKSVNGNDFRRK